jgi:AcrR family transcriptional regulator
VSDVRRDDARAVRRVRMTGTERRNQLLDVGRSLFAEKGFDATSIEEIAAKAKVSKPVVYEHFGGKEGLYAVVVDREMEHLLDRVTGALSGGDPRELLEQAALALLDYVYDDTDGFRILVRDSPVAASTGTFASLISDIASQVEYILAREFKSRGLETKLAGLYSQALVGMVALTGQWWLEARKPKRDEVAAHLVNLAWNGLSHLEAKPRLLPRRQKRSDDRPGRVVASDLGLPDAELLDAVQDADSNDVPVEARAQSAEVQSVEVQSAAREDAESAPVGGLAAAVHP